MRPTLSTFRLAAMGLLATLPPALVAPEALAVMPAREYVRGCRLAAAGETDEALAVLGPIAEANPAWIAAHHALAVTALDAGGDRTSEQRRRLYERVRRSSRDVGASVGYGVFLQHEGRTDEAHRLFLSALLAGAREPVLAELLLDTAPEVDGLVDWLRRRASVLPGDAPFAALRAQVLAEVGRIDDALLVLAIASRDSPDDPWLASLRVDLLRARGEPAEACRLAVIADGLVAARGGIPEVLVPRRLALARAFLACGRIDDARRLTAAPDPLGAPPGVDLARSVRAAQAELLLGTGQPLAALAMVEAEPPGTARERDRWDEVLLSTRVRSEAALGLTLSREPPEEWAGAGGPALADRAVALATLASTQRREEESAVELLERTSALLRASGLGPRADRLRLLAAWLSRRAPDEPEAESRGRALAEYEAARALVSALEAREGGRAEQAFAAASPPTLTVAAAPGSLKAALAVVASRAALEAGRLEDARRRAEEGQLDLQEADRSGRAPIPEFKNLIDAALEGHDPGVMLAGLEFRARIEAGDERPAAIDELLSDLGRALRGWSTLPAEWPRTASSLGAIAAPGSCAVIATGAGGADAVAFAGKAEPVLAPGESILDIEPCASARAILWFGPQATPGGLVPDATDRRLLVRVTGLAPRAPRNRSRRVAPVVVGPGGPSPVSSVVARLANAPTPRVDGTASIGGWPLFVGAGLTIPASPLASGWLAPTAGGDPQGWLGPDSIPSTEGLSGAGLVAAGIRALPTPGASKGERVLADAGLEAGFTWTLLSTRPLSVEEVERLRGWMPALARNLPRSLERLSRDDPQLASAVRMWSIAEPWSERGRARWEGGWSAPLMLLALGAAAVWVLVRRMRRS